MLILHTFYYAIARGLPAVIGFFSIALYTHLLTPEQYGDYVIIVAYAGVIDGFIFQWLRLSCFRFYPIYENKLNKFLSTVLSIFSLLVLTSITTAGLLWLVLPPVSIKEMLPAIVLVMCSKAWFELNQTMANVSMSPKRYGLQGLGRALISLLIGGSLAYCGYGGLSLVLGFISGNIFYSLFAKNEAWQRIIQREFDKEISKELLRYGIPLSGTVLLSSIVAATDRLMLGWFYGSNEAGLYAASYDITKNVLGIIMMIITLGTKPHAVRALEQGDPKVFEKSMTEQFNILLAISLPTSAVLAGCAPNVATVLMGEKFHQSAIELIPLIAIVAFLMGIRSYYFDLSFQLSGKTSGQLKVMIQAAVLHCILNLILVPYYAKSGAVYASLLTFSFALYISARDGRKTLALPTPIRSLLKVSFISIIIYSTLYIIALYFHGIFGLSIQALSAGIIYLIMLYSFDLLDIRNFINNLLKKHASRKN